MSLDLARLTPDQCRAERISEGIVITTTSEEPGFVVTDERAAISDLLAGRFIVIRAENTGDTNVALTLFFWSNDAATDRSDATVTLKSVVRTKSIAPADVGASMNLWSVESHDEEPDYELPDRTIVDELGQWAEREWPGKTHGVEELTAYLSGEVASIDAASGPDESGVNRWGGFVSSRLGGPFEPTGYFSAVHVGTRHLLADPDGYPFYSLGLDCVREDIDARIDGIERLFSWLPPRSGELSEFRYRVERPMGTGEFVDFLGANLRRALGPDWFGSWARLTETRMRTWGFNTIGNWSSETFVDASILPYVVPLDGTLRTGTSIFRDFPDVFSSEYERVCERHARQLERYRREPVLGRRALFHPQRSGGARSLRRRELPDRTRRHVCSTVR